MGNNCCSVRSSDATGGFGNSLGEGTITPLDESKFRQDLLDKYKFHRIDFSTFGGETEAAVLVENDKAIARSRPILV